MGKNVEGSGRDLFEVICRNLNGGTEENHKKLSKDDRYPSRDSNREPPEY